MQKRFTSIASVGQKFLDKPLYRTLIAMQRPRRLSAAVAIACGNQVPPVLPEKREFIGWERTHLRWMKPGPDGKLVPRGSSP